MRVLGLDLSLHGSAGVVLEGRDLTECRVVDSFRVEPVARKTSRGASKRRSGSSSQRVTEEFRLATHAQIADRVVESCRRHSPDLVLVEGYAFAKFTSSLTPLAEVVGVVRHAIYRATGSVALMVPSTTARLLILGDAHSPKDDVVAFLAQHHGVVSQTPDEADAYVVARCGFFLDPEKRPPDLSAKQLKSLDKWLEYVLRQPSLRPAAEGLSLVG